MYCDDSESGSQFTFIDDTRCYKRGDDICQTSSDEAKYADTARYGCLVYVVSGWTKRFAGIYIFCMHPQNDLHKLF